MLTNFISNLEIYQTKKEFQIHTSIFEFEERVGKMTLVRFSSSFGLVSSNIILRQRKSERVFFFTRILFELLSSILHC